MRVIVSGQRSPTSCSLKPAVDGLDAAGADTVIVHTGPHYDDLMSDVFFDELGLRPPDRHVGTGSSTHAEQAGRVMIAFEALVAEVEADAAVVRA
jgi:UDP-N-acetylglucosamine 2-epimerase (non-hydrolysing)